MAYVVVGCRVLLAVVFGLSAASKLRGRRPFERFVDSVGSIGALPRRRARPVAGMVVAAEAAMPALLLWPGTAGAGLVLACCFLVALTVAVVAALRRGVRAPCACFGGSTVALGRWHVVRNVLLLLVAVGGGIGVVGAHLGGATGPDPTGVVVAAVAGCALAGPIARLDDLVELFRTPAAVPRRQ